MLPDHGAIFDFTALPSDVSGQQLATPSARSSAALCRGRVKSCAGKYSHNDTTVRLGMSPAFQPGREAEFLIGTPFAAGAVW
jgi:hypothetical protein